MRLLILGGTVFLGRHVAAEALARGHEVTLLHRGRHGSELFRGVERLLADRTGDLSVLDGRRFDAAIDTSGYDPRVVAASTRRLSDAGLAHLVLVSSVSVYRAWPAEPVTEDSPVWSEGDDYGALKAACERAAGGDHARPRGARARAASSAGRTTTSCACPGGCGGSPRVARSSRRAIRPPDPAHRRARPGRVDARPRRSSGAAARSTPRRRSGAATIGEVLDAAVAATGSGARLTWIADDVLVAAGVQPWDGLPLWLPAADAPGAWRVDAMRAQRAGLRCRPVAETVADVWAWLRTGGDQELGDWRAEHRPSGLSARDERALLAAAAGRG